MGKQRPWIWKRTSRIWGKEMDDVVIISKIRWNKPISLSSRKNGLFSTVHLCMNLWSASLSWRKIIKNWKPLFTQALSIWTEVLLHPYIHRTKKCCVSFKKMSARYEDFRVIQDTCYVITLGFEGSSHWEIMQYVVFISNYAKLTYIKSIGRN